MLKKIFFLFLIYSSVLSAFGQRKINVLFVGNSLTYYNNLPELVSLIAKSDSVQLTYKMLAFPNYALEDHLNDGLVPIEIKSGKYDFVIVQQGPSSQQEGRTMLLDDALEISRLCKENKTRLAFYTVWPSKARSMDFPAVLETYQLAADSTKSILCPAGKAWLKVWESNPDFKLYGQDDFHPNYQGSLLAAFVIYGSVLRKTNLRFASYQALKKFNLTKTDFKILLQAAEHVLVENKKQQKQKRQLSKP